MLLQVMCVTILYVLIKILSGKLDSMDNDVRATDHFDTEIMLRH